MPGRQGRCLPPVGQEVTARRDGGGAAAAGAVASRTHCSGAPGCGAERARAMHGSRAPAKKTRVQRARALDRAGVLTSSVPFFLSLHWLAESQLQVRGFLKLSLQAIMAPPLWCQSADPIFSGWCWWRSTTSRFGLFSSVFLSRERQLHQPRTLHYTQSTLMVTSD
jgi:hypothetical protein